MSDPSAASAHDRNGASDWRFPGREALTSSILRHTAALAFVLLAFLAKLALRPALDVESPFLLFYAAICAAAWIGGLGAGLTATAAAALLSVAYLGTEGGLATPTLNTIGLAAFVLEGAVASYLVASLRAARRVTRTAEGRLHESEEQCRVVLQSATDYAILTMDLEGRITSWSAGAQRIFGYGPQEMLGRHGRAIFTPEDIQRGAMAMEMERALKEGRAEDERWHVRRDGSRFWGSGVLMPLYERSRRRVRGFLRILRDQTSQRNSAEQTKAAREEKELLLKEIRHRVKNNLQVVSSLLNLEAESLADPSAVAALRDSQHRIRSMALVHEGLDSSDLSTVAMAAYVKGIAEYLAGAHENGRVQLHVHTDDLRLPVGQAMPCGLILNELITNALRHAFPDRHEGAVWVNFRAANEQLELTVRDNGVGLAPEPAGAPRASLGLKLVDALVSQLDGTVDIELEQGTTFIIRFPRLTERSGEPGAPEAASASPSR